MTCRLAPNALRMPISDILFRMRERLNPVRLTAGTSSRTSRIIADLRYFVRMACYRSFSETYLSTPIVWVRCEYGAFRESVQGLFARLNLRSASSISRSRAG